MTEQEARKKAEAAASTICPGMDCTDTVWCSYYDIYMQCFRDMCSGEPDGWCAWHPTKGWDLLTFDESQKESDKLSLGNDADDSGWSVVPVKLLRCGVVK